MKKKQNYKSRLIKKYKIKNDAFKEKYLKYTTEKRVAEEYYVIKKDRLLVKNLINSFVRDSFFLKKKRKKERLVFSLKKWKNQFIFFDLKKNRSKTIREELSWLRKRQEVNIIYLKHYYFKSILVEDEIEFRVVSGTIKKLKNKNNINSIINLVQKVGKREEVHHFSFCYNLSLLGIIPALVWKERNL